MALLPNIQKILKIKFQKLNLWLSIFAIYWTWKLLWILHVYTKIHHNDWDCLSLEFVKKTISAFCFARGLKKEQDFKKNSPTCLREDLGLKLYIYSGFLCYTPGFSPFANVLISQISLHHNSGNVLWYFLSLMDHILCVIKSHWMNQSANILLCSNL